MREEIKIHWGGEKVPKFMLILKNILKGREEKTGKLVFIWLLINIEGDRNSESPFTITVYHSTNQSTLESPLDSKEIKPVNPKGN